MRAAEFFEKCLAGYAEGAQKKDLKTFARTWWRLMRPPFFITAAVPVCVALAFVLREGVAPDGALWLKFAGLLVGCFCGLTIANLANELFDYVLGVDDREGAIGGTGMIQAGLVSCRELFFATLLFVVLTIVIGLALVCSLPADLHAPLILLTLFAVASAVFYVAPPIRYGHRGLGEVMVGLNMGLVIVGASSAILAGSFDARSLAVSLPVAGMVAGILYYQSLPEIETDLAAGKRTLANILGKDHALFAFRLWWPAIWFLMFNLWLSDLAGWPVVFCLLAVPFWLKAQRLIAAHGDGDWLPLDAHGYLVRLCYLISGAALVWGAATA